MRLDAFELQPAALSNSIVSAQLRDAPGRLRPAAVRAAEAGEMLLVGEARHGVVGLRLEPRARDASLGGRGEHRQPRPCDQIVDERGQEHGLAGARQAGHAQAQPAAGKVIAERAGDEPGLEDEIGENRQGLVPGKSTRLFRRGGPVWTEGQSVSAPSSDGVR